MGILGGIIGGIAGLGQSLIDSRTQRANVDRTNAANLGLAKYQYNTQVEMWNKANAYNTPEQQMARFKAAGLNPNLIYGQGNSGNTATALPRYQAPTVKYDYQPAVNLPQMLSMYQDFKLRNAQISATEAKADDTRVSAILKGVEKLRKENLLQWETGPDGLLSSKNVYQLNKANMANYQATVLRATIDDQIRKMQLQNQKMSAEIPNTLARTKYTDIMSQYRAKDVRWYTAKNLSNMIAKGIGAVGFANLMKKQPIILNRGR